MPVHIYVLLSQQPISLKSFLISVMIFGFKGAGSYPRVFLLSPPYHTAAQIKLNCRTFLKHYFFYGVSASLDRTKRRERLTGSGMHLRLL